MAMAMDKDLLVQARSALKAGDKPRARALCQDALRLNPRNHFAWLTMAVAAPSADATMEYVRQAERIKPDDLQVKKGLAWANRRLERQKEKTAVPPLLPAPSPILPPAQKSEKQEKRGGWWKLLLAVLLIFALLGGAAFTYAQRGPADIVPSTAVVVESTSTSVPTAVPTSSPKPQPTPRATATPHPIRPKNIVANSKNEVWATWTMTPTPTNTPTPSPTWQPTFRAPQEGNIEGRPLGIGRYEKWIDVDLSTQTLIAYEGDALVFQTYISSGLAPNRTVTGQFRIWLRFESQTMDGSLLGYDYYLEDVPYVMYFFEDYALHGTFWHNNFGYPMSHGCVNMETGDAGWIFEWSEVGTVVNVHE